MKKIFALLLAFLMLLSIMGCDSEKSTKQNNKKENNQISNTTTTIKSEKETTEKIVLNPTWSNYNEMLYWNKIENAEYYTVQIENNKAITTTNTYYEITNLTPNQTYSASVEVKLKNSNQKVKETCQINVSGILKTESENYANNKLKYSIVTIKIEQYNTTLGFIKTDERTEVTTGTICKKNGNDYSIICYSSLLRSNTSYDKTKITITDVYNNTYNGNEITPTKIDNRILSVISFHNEKTTLPVVNFGHKLCNDKYIMEVSISASKNAITAIGKLDGTIGKIKINNISTTKPVIKTTLPITPNSNPIFNSSYELVGISYEYNNSTAFIQLKEILEYIDFSLSNKCGEWVKY